MTKLNLVRVTIRNVNTGDEPLPRDVVSIVRQRFAELGQRIPNNADLASIAPGCGYVEVPEEVLAGEPERIIGPWQVATVKNGGE